MRQNRKSRTITRRGVVASALIPVSALTSAQKPPAALSKSQREILEAFADRLVPHDELGPSASEAGAVEYIDRSLSGFLANEKSFLLAGLAALDAFARRTYDAPFARLAPAKQDEALLAMESNTAPG